jgi:hypothetical protein
VQSTTRYRPKNNTGRRGGSGNSRLHQNHSARARSGRKGGITASKTRAASSRKSILRGAESSTFSMASTQRDHHHQEGPYDHPIGYHYFPGPREEPATPPEAGPNEFMFPNHSSQSALSAATPSHHGYTFTSNIHHSAPPQTFPQHPQNLGNPYTLADITGTYQGQPTTISERGQGLGLNSGLPAGFDTLFANPDEIIDDRVPYLPWGNPGAGGSYHS